MRSILIPMIRLYTKVLCALKKVAVDAHSLLFGMIEIMNLMCSLDINIQLKSSRDATEILISYLI